MEKEESQAPDAEKSKKKLQKQCKICYIGKICGIFLLWMKNYLPIQKREKISSSTSGEAFSPVMVPRS